jgi:16S rRNA (cytidine1402-2'-O)-methyltransferase
MTKPTLYLVPNTLDFGIDTAEPASLDEVLPMAVLRRAAALRHWVAENAKTTRAFLKRVDKLVPLALPLQQIDIVELPRPPKGAKAPGAAATSFEPLLAPLQAGHDLGLISEAGLPAVADPGAELVRLAHSQAHPVVALPGPSSLLLALAASGLQGQSFAFVGYLPIDAMQRAGRIRELEALSRRSQQTQLMIETPYRNAALLDALLSQLQPLTRLSVSCALTLPDGFSRSDTVAAWRARPTVLPVDRPAVFLLLAP